MPGLGIFSFHFLFSLGDNGEGTVTRDLRASCRMPYVKGKLRPREWVAEEELERSRLCQSGGHWGSKIPLTQAHGVCYLYP